MGGSIERKKQFDVKTSKNVLKNFNLGSNFEHKTDEGNINQKHRVGKLKRKEKRNQPRPAGKVCKMFTPEEVHVLIDAIEKSGDKVDIFKLARDLDRERERNAE